MNAQDVFNFLGDTITGAVQQYVDRTVITATAYKMVISRVSGVNFVQFVVSHQLLQQGDSHFVVLVHISISPDKDHWIGKAFRQVIQAVPELGQVSDKGTIFTMSWHINCYMDRSSEARHLEYYG